jgi:spore coat protein H
MLLLFLTACSTPPLAPVGDMAPPELEEAEPEAAVVLPAVVLNEVQTDNDATVMTPDLVFADWVELYNASSEPVALSRLSLSDGEEIWTGGEGALAAGAHVLLWADTDLPFGLSKAGERLALSVDGVVVDRLATGELVSDVAWARYPDGGAWALTARPTPGWTNGSRPGDLWIDDAQWALLEADHYSYIEASMATGTAWFPQVGFRKKATVGSNRELYDKAAFKIDLNRFEGHRLGGQQLLTLNSMVQDPTYTAEHLAYTVFRAAGIPAPRVGYVRLSINGVDRGLYALVESVDDVFLERWYADGSGDLFEGAYGVDLETGSIESFEHDEGPEPTDYTPLEAVAAVLAGEPTDEAIAALEALVDLDEVLLNMGIEAVIMHWDGYTTANNYRLYHDPRTERLQLLPWGTDQTFIDNYYTAYGGYGLMFTFCLDNPGCRERYGAALLEAADLVDSLPLLDELERLRGVLGDDIATDPLTEHSAATQEEFLAITRENIVGRPDVIRSLVE